MLLPERQSGGVAGKEASQVEAPGKARQGRVGKYVVDINTVESFLLPLLSPSACEQGEGFGVGGEVVKGSGERGRGRDTGEGASVRDTTVRVQGWGVQERGRVVWVVDEVGKMEMMCPSFFPAVCSLLDGPFVVLGSIPVPRYGRDIQQGQCNCLVTSAYAMWE